MAVPSSTLQSGDNVLRAGSVGACAGLRDTMVDQLAALLLLLSGGVAIDLCFFSRRIPTSPMAGRAR